MKRVWLSVVLALIVAFGAVPVSTAQDDSAAFRDLASGSDFRVRVAAALALGRSKSPGARAALERALSDPHPAVRAAAAAGLGRLGDSGAVPALRSALGRESTPSVKTQLETTIKKLEGSSAPAGRAKFLVQLGRIDVRAGAVYNAASLKAATRSKMASLPGVEVMADGADVGAASQSRGLPGFTLDGSLTKLLKAQSSGGVSVSARVEYLVKKMPDHTIKATMSGTAEAEADPREIRGAKEMDQLQQDAVNAAVDSAFKQASRAFEASSK